MGINGANSGLLFEQDWPIISKITTFNFALQSKRDIYRRYKHPYYYVRQLNPKTHDVAYGAASARQDQHPNVIGQSGSNRL